MDEHMEQADPGLSRRSVIKRGAAIGGAVLWATPVVQSIGGTAWAQQGSPCRLNIVIPGTACPVLGYIPVDCQTGVPVGPPYFFPTPEPCP
jgi:hypothetical protein